MLQVGDANTSRSTTCGRAPVRIQRLIEYAVAVSEKLLLSVALPLVAFHVADAGEPTYADIEAFMTIDSETRVIAHRGFSGKAPENTIAAVEMAIEAGAHMVEVDVTMTADDHVICLHDETLDRTTNGRGRPTDITLEEIRKLDAGSWFSARFSEERVPTLAEVFDAVKGRVLVNVEIKPEAVDHGIVPLIAALIADHGLHDQVVVSSFAPEALRRIKLADPDVFTASLFNSELHSGKDPLEIMLEVGSRGFNISGKRLTPEIIDRCHRSDIPVAVYTVNEVSELLLLDEMGVDAIFTDHPDRMLNALSEARTVPAETG
jgi:glycerophosphoryl diester phosphodiesterase